MRAYHYGRGDVAGYGRRAERVGAGGIETW